MRGIRWGMPQFTKTMPTEKPLSFESGRTQYSPGSISVSTHPALCNVDMLYDLA